MGLVIKAALGALVVVLIGVLAKTKNYYIAGLIPLFPTFALIAHYIVASERGIEALRATIIFSMWSIIPYFIYLASLWYFTGIMRLPAAFVGSVLGTKRMGADYLLDETALTQMSTSIKRETAPGNKATGEQVIDQIDHLFLARRGFHQRFIQRLLAIFSIIMFIKQDQRRCNRIHFHFRCQLAGK